MNGDTLAWILVERAHADAPDTSSGHMHAPPGAVHGSREEAEAAASWCSRDEQGRPNVIVAELIDRRTASPTATEE